MSDAPHISIIVPMCNEAICIVENLQKIQTVLGGSGIRYEMIVVDDGSTDDSYSLVSGFSEGVSNVRVLQHSGNKGASEAIRTGLRSARGKYAIHLDADLQFAPADVVRFYEHACETRASVVWGSSDKGSYPFIRRFVSKAHNALSRILFDVLESIDVNAIRLMEMSALEDFCFSTRKESIGLELLLYFRKHNYEIAVLPIVVGKREKGKSKFHIGLIFQSIGSMMSLLFFTRQC